MRRKIFSFISAMTLLLWAAMVLLWAWSHWRGDDFSYVSRSPSLPNQSYFLQSAEGAITFTRFVRTAPSLKTYTSNSLNMGFSSRHWGGGIRRYSPPTNRLGFAVNARSGPYGVQHDLVAPYYAIVSVMGVWPVIVGWRRFKRRRQKPAGHCLRCSYDLRGNESGICPECGTSVAGNNS
jgi:hypothetical protein